MSGCAEGIDSFWHADANQMQKTALPKSTTILVNLSLQPNYF